MRHMPWSKVRGHAECGADEIAVVADDTGEVMGCHGSEDDANAQIAALYANEEDMTGDPVLSAVYNAFAAAPAPDPSSAVSGGQTTMAPVFEAHRYSKGLWRGVLAVEGVETGDWPRREFQPGSLVWRDLPLSIYWQRVTAEEHDNAVIVANVVDIWREGNAIRGWGRFALDTVPEAVEVHSLVGKGFMRGISVTLDDIEDADVEYVFPESEDQLADDVGDLGDDALAELFMDPEKVIFHHARIMDSCLTGQPALPDAFVELVPDDEEASLAAHAPSADAEPEPVDAGSPESVLASLTAAGEHTSVVVVARPEDPDSLVVPGGDPADELHVTLGYFGEAADLPEETLAALHEFVAEHPSVAAEATVGGLARMGSDDPPAVTMLLESVELAALRADLELVAEPDRTHPHFTPHLTLGYGIDMPDALPTSTVKLGAVELWVAGERYDASGTVIASAVSIPDDPPYAWFQDPKFTEPTPWTVLDNGRCFGHLAEWDTCHIGIGGTCRTPPRAPGKDYRHYCKGDLVTADGKHVAVGQITLGSDHAPRPLNAVAAAEHYENTQLAIADVAAGEDRFGIWVAGALRPVDSRVLRVVRAAGISGDWRDIRHSMRLVGAMFVNVPGFPNSKPRAFSHNGEQTALVAAGVVQRRLSREQVALMKVGDMIAASIGRDWDTRAASLVASAYRQVHPTPGGQ